MRDSFARLLSERGDEGAVRKAMDTPAGYDLDLWEAMAEMGLLGVIIDPAYDGIGGDAELLEDLMEEAGKNLLCSPFISTSVLAASLITASSDDGRKQELLPAICSGQQIVAVALTGEQGLWTGDDVDLDAEENDGSWSLNGTASFVLHAEAANLFLVVAKTGNGIRVFLVDPQVEGVKVKALKANDPTLRISKIMLSDCPAEELDGVGEREIARAMDFARVALAGEQAGGTKQIFDITIEYLRTRHQFGRQIGSYQSLKHMAADMLIEVETAASAARDAARALATDADDAQILINLAAFACADAYRDVSAQAIQLHGGIAYTWEHSAHLYWRRARTGMWLFGSSDHYREQYLTQLEVA